MVSRSILAAAALLAVSLFSLPARAQTACATSIQGSIPWDHEGNTRWSDTNLAKLCAGQENSVEPGRCYAEVMSGRVSFGSGTRWAPGNAVSLCAGAPNAKTRVGCFSREIGKGATWNTALKTCAPAQSAAAVASVQTNAAAVKTAPVTTQPLNTTPAADPAQRAHTEVSKISCKAPLKFSMKRVPTRDRPLEYEYKVEFTAATSARDMQPGQCWRDGGWDFPLAVNYQRQGWLMYRSDLRNCPFFESFSVDNGKFTETRINDAYFGDWWFQQAVGKLPFQAVEAKWSGRAGDGSSDPPIIYVVETPDLHQPRRPGCG